MHTLWLVAQAPLFVSLLFSYGECSSPRVLRLKIANGSTSLVIMRLPTAIWLHLHSYRAPTIMALQLGNPTSTAQDPSFFM